MQFLQILAKRMQILSQYGLSDTFPEHVPLSGQTPFVVRSGIRLLQLNVESYSFVLKEARGKPCT